MGSKKRQTRLDQKSTLEDKLNRRLSDLAEKGVEPQNIAKDTTVKRLRADIRKAVARLKAIEALENQREEMAQRKAEKLAAPKKEKAKKKKGEDTAPEVSKRQQKKKGKKESKTQAAQAPEGE
ncbi:MAG: hypothetical protein JW821_04200 [Deltaproteobacteria bacterium]|nr:hypothetical protein [Deltaproteobacteria bacterium]